MSTTTNQEQQQQREYKCRFGCAHIYDTPAARRSHEHISHFLPAQERRELERLGLATSKGTGSSPFQRYQRERVLERKMEARVNGTAGRKKKRKQKDKKDKR